MDLKEFVKKFGRKYSEILGINAKEEPFKWFLASLLFGAPIREEIAMKTYKIFEKYGYTSPEKIIDAGWDEIVKCLDEGGYTRYDFKTADKIMEVCKNLLKGRKIEDILKNEDPKERLKNLAKGIGDTTVNIFLRELGMPHEPSKYAIIAAKKHNLWNKKFKKIEEIDEINLEISLMKLGRDYCKKGKCKECPFPC